MVSWSAHHWWHVLLAVWAAWGLLNLCLVRWLQTHGDKSGYGAYVVGMWRPRVVITDALAEQLTLRERTAVYLHEYGHVRCHHLQLNLLLAVLLPFCRSRGLVVRQELTADWFAARCGYGADLASALRKSSTHPFDLKRAELLEAAGRRDADALRAGCALSNQGECST